MHLDEQDIVDREFERAEEASAPEVNVPKVKRSKPKASKRKKASKPKLAKKTAKKPVAKKARKVAPKPRRKAARKPRKLLGPVLHRVCKLKGCGKKFTTRDARKQFHSRACGNASRSRSWYARAAAALKQMSKQKPRRRRKAVAK